jgi:hypothetical protein
MSAMGEEKGTKREVRHVGLISQVMGLSLGPGERVSERQTTRAESCSCFEGQHV